MNTVICAKGNICVLLLQCYVRNFELLNLTCKEIFQWKPYGKKNIDIQCLYYNDTSNLKFVEGVGFFGVSVLPRLLKILYCIENKLQK